VSRPSLRRALLLLAFVPAAAPARAGARFEVAGAVTATEDALQVEVRLKNVGDRPASPLTVRAELLGERREARIDPGAASGETRTATFSFPLEVPRPGVHALTLLLEFPDIGARAPGTEPTASQRAFLLLALGENPPPAVKVDAPEARIETAGRLLVGIQSADGAAHRVRLRVLTPRGLRADDVQDEVAVPEKGRVVTAVPLLRAGAPRPSQQGVLMVADVVDGPVARNAVSTGVVDIEPDAAWLPRHRSLLVLAVVLLLGGAALEELRRRPGAPAA
jgi:hypothetical protein